jgi:hypothetical protein
MGSVIDQIKGFLSAAVDGPFYPIVTREPDDWALCIRREDSHGDDDYHDMVYGQREEAGPVVQVAAATLTALPQTLRVLDIVHEFLEARRRLRQACCGSSLASRMMREMDACEVRLHDAYQELLYPQTPYTPYEEAKADGS